MKRPASQPPELPGYEYIRLLGSGGFSDVFLYEQRLPRRRVAVKVLLTESLTPQTRKQFADEANLMASLSAHPYIVTIFHADVALDGRPYFVMEYCSGPSLAARYKSRPLGVEEALRVGVRLSSAVATAHAAGILHRDIKPANVLVNEYGAPSLTDFGISSATEDDTLGLTTTSRELADDTATNGSSVGLSVPWAPPEMFSENPRPDIRSDIFSLAATVYTFLAGHTPFEKPGASNSQLDLASRIQRGALTPLSSSGVPASLVAVLSKGMDPKPAGRYAKATDFARALQGIEIELGYNPTALEIPLSNIELPVDRDGSDAEETRVRSVATVEAQSRAAKAGPTAPPTPAQATAEGTGIRSEPRGTAAGALPARATASEDSLESTLVRVTAPTVPALDAPSARPARPARVRRIAPAIVGGIVFLAVIAAGIALISSLPKSVPLGAGPGVASSQDALDPDESPTLDIPAVPVIDSAERSDDGVVVFTWSNPDGIDGDEYVWRRTDGAEKGPANPTSATTATFTSIPPAAQVCIAVVVNRDGQTSEPATACTR